MPFTPSAGWPAYREHFLRLVDEPDRVAAGEYLDICERLGLSPNRVWRTWCVRVGWSKPYDSGLPRVVGLTSVQFRHLISLIRTNVERTYPCPPTNATGCNASPTNLTASADRT